MSNKDSFSPKVDAGTGSSAPAGEATREDRVLKIGLRALWISVAVFFAWAAFAPLDEGVPTMGTVSIDTKRKTVQHFRGGIVREVKVREGQFVRQGDVLLNVDEAMARAEFESGRQQYLGARAAESRLLAEQAGLAKIDFHPDLAKEDDAFVRELMTNQEMLFRSRRGALQAELASIDESVAGLEAQVTGLKGIIDSRRNQQALLREELAGVRDLVGEGYAPRSRQLELERALSEVTGNLADAQGNLVRAQRQIAELHQRATQRRQEFRKEVDGLLADTRREAQAGMERFRAVSDELKRTEVLAPVDGQVVGLAVQTVGAVIAPGEKLMDIVPGDEPLVIEAHVPPQYIDRVRPGLGADVRFSAFAHSPQLVVEGKIESVSRDLVVDPAGTPPAQQTPPYYLARVSVTPEGLKVLGQRTMQPGMSAEVIIKTGSRSLLTYLLYPLVRRLSASLKEE